MVSEARVPFFVLYDIIQYKQYKQTIYLFEYLESPMPCPNLRQTYNLLIQKEKALDEAIAEAINSGDFSHTQIIKQEILEMKESLEEYRVLLSRELAEANETENIREQYEKQKEIFFKVGLLEKREGKLGIEAINGKGLKRKKAPTPIWSYFKKVKAHYMKARMALHPNRNFRTTCFT